MPPGNSRAGVVAACVTGLAAFALYWHTLAPDVLVGDSGEFQFTGAILGIPHPTGYPLYTLLGYLWSLLPLGTVAYRINLSSAVYMAGAVALLTWLIYDCVLRIAYCVSGGRGSGVGGRTATDEQENQNTQYAIRNTQYALAAILGAGLFAVSGTVWSQAVVARSYALNALLIAACLTALWRWWIGGRWAAGWAFAGALGLSLTHHGTTSVLLPGYAWLALACLWRWRGQTAGAARMRGWVGLFGAGLLGLSPYLLLAYRFVFGYTYYWGNPRTWADVVFLARGGPFAGQIFAYPFTPLDQTVRAAFGFEQMYRQFGWAGVALGGLGLLRLLVDRRTRVFGVGLMLLWLGNFAFAVNYGIIGHIYLIPTYLLWGLFMGVAAAWPLAWAARLRWPRPANLLRAAATVALLILAVGVVPGLAALRLAAQDHSGDTRIRDLALQTLAEAPPGAHIYVDWEALCVFRYYRYVEGRRPDLVLYSEDPFNDWAPGIARDLAAGRAAYVGGFAGPHPPAPVRDAYQLVPAGLVYRVVGPLQSR